MLHSLQLMTIPDFSRKKRPGFLSCDQFFTAVKIPVFFITSIILLFNFLP